MLKKSFAFGLLAAGLIIAPTSAVFANQTTGSNSVINQSSVTSGVHNVTGQGANAATIQRQMKSRGYVCGANNQVAASNTVVNQGGGTFGIGNTTGQSAASTTVQTQSGGGCSYPYIYLP